MENTGEITMENTIEQENWFKRNWKWFVPVGGCGVILACIACVAIAAAVLGTTVFGAIKSSEVYQEALSITQRHPRAQAELGTPIEDGFLLTGSINVSGPTGEADFAFPVSGPEGSGKVYVVATKSAGRWRYQKLELALEDSDLRIDLLPGH